MADQTNFDPPRAAQDTGNPVLDSTVNIICARGTVLPDTIKSIHATLLELAAKEPGGLHRHRNTDACKTS